METRVLFGLAEVFFATVFGFATVFRFATVFGFAAVVGFATGFAVFFGLKCNTTNSH